MADARVEIVAYDPRWPAAFERERLILQEALAPWLVGDPVHIGSTAVPGLGAKPVIDIMAPVWSLDSSVDAILAAQAVGYVFFPYKPELMHWFCKPSPAHRTHHLHLVPRQSALWEERIAFRDALRANATLRSAYEALKRELAVRYADDREAYTQAKGAFIAEATAQARGLDQG